MSKTKTVQMLYGKTGMALNVPVSTTVLEGQEIPALPCPNAAVMDALDKPINSASLTELIIAKKPENAAITISDITRPIPNKQFLPVMLDVLNAAGINDSQIVIVIGNGMHRSSTEAEREILVGCDISKRVEVIDHRADDSKTLIKISNDPPISVCRRFAEADFRIVTGYIEAHFMAGFSGGRKGVCPALVDLETIQRFHGYDALANLNSDTGNLKDNPCHEISLKVAKAVGVDFLFNVAITRRRQIAGIYCGELEKAHQAGCKQVAGWITAEIDKSFDFVITSGGGYPLDCNFYQTVKGMCTALPALTENSTLLQISCCKDQIGSKAYTELLLRYNNDWQKFLTDIKTNREKTYLDQWQYQMQTRVLSRIGRDKLWFVSDGIPIEMQKHISVTPVPGNGNAGKRAQRAIDEYIGAFPNARVAVIPEGPYTMIKYCGTEAYQNNV